MNERRTIDAVVICCFRRDIHWVRICVSSVRHWYPEIPIYLLKDKSKGPVRTDDIEKTHNVKILETEFKKGGYGLTKIEAFFGKNPERILMLDSDTVMIGPILDELENIDADFIVTGVQHEDPEYYLIPRDYINARAVNEKFDPDYRYPGFGFNSGQMVITRGLLTREDFSGLVKFDHTGFRTLAPDGLWLGGDQGLLNYLFAKVKDRGLSVCYHEFWLWSDLPEVAELDRGRIFNGEGYRKIVHWAGVKHYWMHKDSHFDILSHYRDLYYSRHPMGRFARHAHEFSRHVDKVITKFRSMLGLA
jgi:hypothetical protein